MPTQQIYSQGLSKTPLVSFIITTYNLPINLLIECLQSVFSLSLGQDEREIILVDDGSDVCTLQELAAYQNQLIYIRQANQGAAAARNLGLKVANGMYIQFIDGDDALIPFSYEHCLDIIRYKNADVVSFAASSSKKGNNAPSVQGPMTGSAYISQNNLQVMVWKYLFKKDILCGLQFTKGLLNEDEEFTPQLLLRAERMYVTDARAYHYRRRKNSCTTSKAPRTLMKRLQDTENILFHFQDRLDSWPEMERNAMRRRIAQLSMDYLYNVARYTHSINHLNKTIERLGRRGLYPLPKKNYTWKYRLFRSVIQTKMGRKFLILLTSWC